MNGVYPPSPGQQPTPTPPVESDEYKTQVALFIQQGFSEIDADLLASAGAQPEQVKHLLQTGCSPDLAVKILV